MLRRIDELMVSGLDFSFETTLASKSFIHTIETARRKGYHVTLIFFWLESIELAIDRVRKRVAEGGHHIDSDVIKRRYKTGVKNLFQLYSNQVDSLLIYDNSIIESELIAEKTINQEFIVHNFQKFNALQTVSQ